VRLVEHGLRLAAFSCAYVADSLAEFTWPQPLHDLDTPLARAEEEYEVASPAAPAGVEDPAAVEGSPPPLIPPAAGSPTFIDFAVPAVCEVLAEHQYYFDGSEGECQCESAGVQDLFDWREHVAYLVAERLETSLTQRFPKK